MALSSSTDGSNGTETQINKKCTEHKQNDRDATALQNYENTENTENTEASGATNEAARRINRDTAVTKKCAVQSKVEEARKITNEENWLQPWHQAFQHYYARKPRDKLCVGCSCVRCLKVTGLLHHKKKCESNQCGFCQLVNKITQFHKDRCGVRVTGFCLFCAENRFTLNGRENTERDVCANRSKAQQWARASKAYPRHETITDEMAKISHEPLTGKEFVDGVDYKLEDELGRGGNGQVSSVKLLDPGMRKLGIQDGNCLAAKKANFKNNEITICKELAEAPNNLKHYFVVNKKSHLPWMDKKTVKTFDHLVFMERAERSLQDERKKKFPSHILNLEKASLYWSHVLETLEYNHGRTPPIVHKDIKSGNVLLIRKDGGGYCACLADYEFAIRLTEDLKTENLPRGGTRLFIAPEVFDGRAHGTAADIYSVGMLLLELTIPQATRPPLNACWSEYQAVKVQELKDIHEGLGSLVESCLNPDDKQRPEAGFLLQQVRKFASEAGWWHHPIPALDSY